MKIIIGIPAFNEEKNIASIITKLMNITDSIIVCNDGSSDLTSEIAEKMGAVVINHEKNLGYGAAIRSIFLKAKELEGDILVKTQQNGKCVDVHIKEGEMFLLPAKIPHSPIRSANSVGLVIERKRKPHHKDGLMWFCDSCNHSLKTYKFKLDNIEKDFISRFKEYYKSEKMRTCDKCGDVMKVDERFA